MNETYLRELAKTLQNFSDTSELEAFLQEILTPKELDEIPKRLQIVKMLKRGVSQREISEQLGVGIATITRGSKELQKGSFKQVT